MFTVILSPGFTTPDNASLSLAMSVITWRRLKRYLALALCFILVTAYLSQAERPQQRTTPDPPQGLDDVCAHFRYPSHFRDVADHIVEGQIEQALLDIEKGALREKINQSTVKKIWQVWKSEEVPEYLFQPRDWKAMHPGWEHTVSLGTVSNLFGFFRRGN